MSLLKQMHDFLSKPATDPAVVKLYHATVEQARSKAFYETYQIPDTIDGRFDLLLLHVILLMRRLREQKETKQQLFDLMFADMDRSLREMGVGDMSIGKKIRPMISAFYGRGQAYEKSILEGDDELAMTLSRNLYGASPPTEDLIEKLVLYVRRSLASLEAQDLLHIEAGRVEFINPLM